MNVRDVFRILANMYDGTFLRNVHWAFNRAFSCLPFSQKGSNVDVRLCSKYASHQIKWTVSVSFTPVSVLLHTSFCSMSAEVRVVWKSSDVIVNESINIFILNLKNNFKLSLNRQYWSTSCYQSNVLRKTTTHLTI